MYLRTNVPFQYTISGDREQVFFCTIRTFLSRYAQMCNSSHHLKDATEKVVSLVSQGVKYVQKCSLIIKYC